MRFATTCAVFLACWAYAVATPAVIDSGDSSLRDPKLLFKFITIAPEACTFTTGGSGICYSAADCTTLAGTSGGTCAKGLGVCCRITRTCGQTSGFQETTFVNPSFPSAQTAALGGCQLRITPLNNNICQLRLDFNEFLLSQPNNEGVCDRDFLQLTGGSSNIPLICGENNGQHMYVDVSPQFGSALLNIDTGSVGAKWNIKVTQIECNSANRAPAGCLQYYNTTQGTISSFNFNPSNGVAGDTQQLSSQMYGICIKSQPGYCSVTYRLASNTDFSVSGDPSGLGPAVPPIGNLGNLCTTDYVVIPGATIADTTNLDPALTSTDRFCGIFFPTVMTRTQPFNVFFVSNADEAAAGDIGNRGFEIQYRMNAC